MLIVLIVMAASIIFINAAAFLTYLLIRLYIGRRKYDDAP